MLLSLIWGLILAFGPVEITVNGRLRIVDESKYLGPGLLWLAGFFFCNLSMGASLLLIGLLNKPKEPRPFAYIYLISILPLAMAIYYFVQRIGLKTGTSLLLGSLLGAVGTLVAVCTFALIYKMARGI